MSTMSSSLVPYVDEADMYGIESTSSNDTADTDDTEVVDYTDDTEVVDYTDDTDVGDDTDGGNDTDVADYTDPQCDETIDDIGDVNVYLQCDETIDDIDLAIYTRVFFKTLRANANHRPRGTRAAPNALVLVPVPVPVPAPSAPSRTRSCSNRYAVVTQFEKTKGR